MKTEDVVLKHIKDVQKQILNANYFIYRAK